MSLESVQQANNRGIVGSARVSASLNPKQRGHDMNDLLIKGAEKAAAGQTLGLSEEETLAAVSREYRRQKLKNDQITVEDVERQFAQASKSLADPPELKGISYLNEADVDPFGQDQGQYMEYEPGDKQYDEQQRNKVKEELADAQSAKKRDKGLIADLSAELSLNPEDRPEMAPASVMTDALRALDQSKEQQAGLNRVLGQVFGGSDQSQEGMAQIEGRLEQLIPNTGAEASAMKALAAELVKRDGERFDSEVAEYNDYRAAAEANILGQNFTAGGPGTMADEAIGRIGEVRSIGKVGETAQVIRYGGDSSSFPVAKNMNGVYVDPRTGQPVAVQETLPTALAGSNTPNSANQLNAPTRESATEYVARMMPDYSQSGRVFGDYPQVDITGATTLFADRVRGLAAGGVEQAATMPTNIRSISEFERTLDMVRDAGLKKGKKFYDMEQTDGGVKSVRTTDPGPQAVLNFLRYTPAEQEQLAGALYQLDAARRSSVNQNPDSMYYTRTGPRGRMDDVTFDAAEAINPRDGQAQVAKFTRGERIEGQQVSDAIRGLSPEAAMPFKGEIAGEKQPILRQTKVPTAQSPGRKGPEYIRQIRNARGQNKNAEDIEQTRKMQVNNVVAEERAKRAASDRQQKEADITALRGTPPKARKVYGDGAGQRQVEEDARQQSKDMELSDMIRDMRRRRS